jgi:carboxymethylenebutenolidase
LIKLVGKNALIMKEITRRKFIATATLSAGFALAVQPISAKVINTDVLGLVAGAVKIPVKDGKIPAYRAMPAKGISSCPSNP